MLEIIPLVDAIEIYISRCMNPDFNRRALAFAGVLAASEAGLALDPAYLSLLAKRAHAYLFLGQIREAEQIYRGHRGEVVDAKSKRTWEQVVLKDFDDLEKAGLTHPEFARIRELLKTEVK